MGKVTTRTPRAIQGNSKRAMNEPRESCLRVTAKRVSVGRCQCMARKARFHSKNLSGTLTDGIQETAKN